VWDVRVKNHVALVTSEDGLSIFDVRDPSKPQELSLFPSQSAREADTEGNYVYLAAAREGFYVLDISDPIRPQRVALVTPDDAQEKFGRGLDTFEQVRVVESRWAIVTASTGGHHSELITLDISNPVALQLVAILDVEGGNPPMGISIRAAVPTSPTEL